MSVVYATVNGVLVEEGRGGIVTCNGTDTLGSVILTRDALAGWSWHRSRDCLHYC